MKVIELIETQKVPLELIAGKAGIDNEIKNDFIYFPELLITGISVTSGMDSIQILTVDALDFAGDNLDNFKNLTKTSPPCIIIPHDYSSPKALINICEEHRIPLLVTHLTPIDTRNRIEYILEIEFALSTHIHGTLIDVFGMGVIIQGQSGIGKTEWALDLVFRGHRLVTDDVVKVIKLRDGRLVGEGIEESKKLKYHIEIRGIGILDLQSMFGMRGVRERKALELIVTLYEGRCETLTEITGIETKKCNILGVELPEIRIPVTFGKNISSLIEGIALNKLLKLSGIDSAKKFDKELIKVMKTHKKGKGKRRKKD
ncbi:HPr(Ser) kinase/phosphatase [candidate division WOR-3 bacterium]|nr:HPr(Ser) kinase/phosphatase [candidate division WOR-3 bacterium]